MLCARVDVPGLPVWPSLLITRGRVLFCVNVVQPPRNTLTQGKTPKGS